MGFYQRPALIGGDSGTTMSKSPVDRENVKGRRRSKEPVMEWTLRMWFRMWIRKTTDELAAIKLGLGSQLNLDRESGRRSVELDWDGFCKE